MLWMWILYLLYFSCLFSRKFPEIQKFDPIKSLFPIIILLKLLNLGRSYPAIQRLFIISDGDFWQLILQPSAIYCYMVKIRIWICTFFLESYPVSWYCWLNYPQPFHFTVYRLGPIPWLGLHHNLSSGSYSNLIIIEKNKVLNFLWVRVVGGHSIGFLFEQCSFLHTVPQFC